jgi:hypothetical protein
MTMHSQVRQLDLKLSLPAALQSESSQIVQELRAGFLSRVIEAVEDRLHAEFGRDAIIEIPDLNVRWEGRREAFSDYEYARRLGEEIVGEVITGAELQTVAAASRDIGSESTIRVYKNSVHRSTVRIVTLSHRQARRTTLEQAEKIEAHWREVAERGARALYDCVKYVADHGDAEEVLGAIGLPFLESLTDVLPVARWPIALRKTILRRRNESRPPTAADDSSVGNSFSVAHASDVEYPPPTKREALSAGKTTEMPAEKTGGTVPPDTSAPALESHGGPRSCAPDDADGAMSTVGDASASSVERHESVRHDAPPASGEAELPASGVSRTSTPTLAAVRSRRETGTAGAISPRIQSTRFAGLVYVLNLIRRIELPEILWCSTIDERSFLFDLVGEIAGDAGRHDPIVYAISGIEADRSNYRRLLIPQWACDDVVSDVHRRLGRLVSRAGIESTGTPYPDLDTRLCDESVDGCWAGLVDRLARRLRIGFMSLIRPKQIRAGFSRFIALDGAVAHLQSTTEIRIPIECVDLGVRKSGLDADPKHIEWLGRALTIRYVS